MKKTTLSHPTSHKKATKKSAKKVHYKVHYIETYITPRSNKSKGVTYFKKTDSHPQKGVHIAKKASASTIRRRLKISSKYSKAASKIVKLKNQTKRKKNLN